jgi:hypothetical protein
MPAYPTIGMQGRPLVERLKGIGQMLGIGQMQSEGHGPQQEQLIGARLQGEAREALIATMAVSHPGTKVLYCIGQHQMMVLRFSFLSCSA